MDAKRNGMLVAFPTPDVQNSTLDGEGLSKRELIAAMAMQSLAPQFCREDDPLHASEIADYAIRIADALLRALAEPQEKNR